MLALIQNLLDLDPIIPEDAKLDEEFSRDLKGRGNGRMVTPGMLSKSKRKLLPKGTGRAPFSLHSVNAVRLPEELAGSRFGDPFENAVAEETERERMGEAADRKELVERLARFNIEPRPEPEETNQNLRDLLQAVRNRVPTYIDVDGDQRLVEVFPAAYFRNKK